MSELYMTKCDPKGGGAFVSNMTSQNEAAEVCGIGILTGIDLLPAFNLYCPNLFGFSLGY